jgi:1,4-dihydroxy-2-naphthoyl-CoA hydrolase
MNADEATEFLHRSMSLCATLGMRAEVFSPEEVTLVLDWSADLLTSGEALHGGALMALADSAGGACAYLNLPEGASGTSTIESKTNFLGGVRNGTVRATSRPLHRGSTTIVVETELHAGDKLVAKTTQTQAVLRPRT